MGEKNRIEYIDLAKGICIMLVVLYHICVHYKLHSEWLVALSTFRMPLYFFLSGLFFKQYEGFGGFLLRKTNKLLIPFLFFFLITSFLLPNALYLIGHTVSHTESLGVSGLWAFVTKEDFANNPLWFLWCLFLVNILFYSLFQVTGKLASEKIRVVSLLVICFGIGCIGYWLFSRGYNIPAFIDSSMSALPFFVVGYVCRKYTKILYPNKYDRFSPIFILVCAGVVFLLYGFCNYKKNEYAIPPFNMYSCGVAGTLAVLFIAKMIKTLPIVSMWGRYSIMVLITHGLLLQVLVPLTKKFIPSIPLAVLAIFVAMVGIYQFLIPLMRKYLPYVTAQKDVIKIPE